MCHRVEKDGSWTLRVNGCKCGNELRYDDKPDNVRPLLQSKPKSKAKKPVFVKVHSEEELIPAFLKTGVEFAEVDSVGRQWYTTPQGNRGYVWTATAMHKAKHLDKQEVAA